MAVQRGHGLGIYEGLDDVTAITVIQLQIDDIDEAVATAMNTSEAQALLLQREELQRTQSVITDRRISIQSVHIDRQNATNNANTVAALIAVELQAEADHAMARRLAGLPALPPRPEFIMPRPHLAVNTPPTTPRAVLAPGSISRLTFGQPNVATPPHTPIDAAIQPPPNSTSDDVQPGAFNFRGDHLRIRSTGTPLQQSESSIPSTTFDVWSLAPTKKKSSDNVSSNTVPNHESRSNPVSQEAPTTKRLREEELDGVVVQPKCVDIGDAKGVDLTGKRARDEDSDSAPAPKRAKPVTKITFAEYIARMKGNNVSNTTSNQEDDTTQGEAQEQIIETRHINNSSAAAVQTTTEVNPTTPSMVLNGTTPTVISRKRSREEGDIGSAPPAKRVDTGYRKLVETETNLMLVDPQHIVGSTATTKPPVTRMSECVSCMKSLVPFFLCVAECKHEYCRDCLRTVVQNALVDEAMFPPRCCKQPFAMDSMRPFLTPELVSNYGEKKVEFEIEDRTYCSNLSCSTFLYPDNILHNEGVCPNCFTVTCVFCKAPEHNGDCPKDFGIQEVMELAAKEGWKRCEKCHRVVELKVGCNHIT